VLIFTGGVNRNSPLGCNSFSVFKTTPRFLQKASRAKVAVIAQEKA